MDAPEREPPYPVIAINDLTENYSADHLRFAIEQCRNVIAQVIAEDNRSDQQVARVKIIRYLDLQLTRAAKWAEDDTDLMANVMRSLIELLAWAEFVSTSNDNATRFIEEGDVDSKELIAKFVKAMPPDKLPADILDVLDKLGEQITDKRVSLKRSGDQEEFIWKFCSKLIHPSSLILTNPEMTIKAAPFRQFLAIRAVTFGWRIIYKVHHVNFTT